MVSNKPAKSHNHPDQADQTGLAVPTKTTDDKLDELVDRLLAKPQALGRTVNAKGEFTTVSRSKIKTEVIVKPFSEGIAPLGDNTLDGIRLKATAVKNALLSGSEELKQEALDAILGDLVMGAYQDKLAAYLFTATDRACGDLDKAGLVQARRQAADKHLIQVLKAVQDIRRPPVKVVIKEAGQVNVAEQINNADRQVNLPPGKFLP
jgi:hypothetical protein